MERKKEEACGREMKGRSGSNNGGKMRKMERKKKKERRSRK